MIVLDGSSSAYYYAEATDAELSNTWLFFLQGGGQCYSEKTCNMRDPNLKSSTRWSSTITKTGIFDSDATHSSLWGSHKVFVPYCSSDGWIGDAPASPTTWGYHFRGQRIIRSALADLVSTGLVTDKSRVLFGGGSAGGRGMMNNVDYLVQHSLPAGATVLGAFLDSPYTIDIVPYDSGFAGFQYETKEIYARYNVTAIVPDDCAAMYPADSEDAWKCVYGQYRMPFVTTPYVLMASQYDSYQLSFNTGTEPVNGKYVDPGAAQYAQKWSDETEGHLRDLDRSNGNKISDSSKNFILSWQCYNHDVSETSRFWTLTASGISQYEAVRRLQTGSTGASWIEDCVGLFCGSGCE